MAVTADAPARGRMLRFGLTGGIGSGKSTAAARIADRGFPVIDADDCVRKAARPGSPAHAEILALLGPEIARADGTLDRAAIASRVFGDADLRRRLEAILHPRVARVVADWFDRQEREGRKIAFYQAPLLFEAGHDRGLDGVIVVVCPEDTRIRRAAARDGVDPAAVAARVRAQLTDTERAAHATHVLRNDGSLADLQQAVDELLDRIVPRG